MREPEITNYYCYRTYLSDFFEYKKAANSNYSYRVFTSKAGLKSSGHLKMIINRDRNLGAKTLPLYVKALGLKKKRDAEFFELLVKYDQTQSIDEKTQLFEKILKEKKKSTSSVLESNQYKLLSKWYVVTIYVLVGMENFETNVEKIYHCLANKIPRVKIENALKILLETGLIKKEEGRYKQTGGAFSTPDEIKAMAVNKYHESMVELSLESLKRDSVEQRNFKIPAKPSAKTTPPELIE
jgi:uncharacterized protein (TIGR02147 family)